MAKHPRITSDANVQGGKPVVVGTDITVESIVRYADQGAGMEQILRMFPRLREEDVQAAIRYSLPSPLKQFIHEQAFLAAALTFAIVGMSAMALGGFGLSINLERAGWPLIFAMAPMYLPAGAAGIAVFVAMKRA